MARIITTTTSSGTGELEINDPGPGFADGAFVFYVVRAGASFEAGAGEYRADPPRILRKEVIGSSSPDHSRALADMPPGSKRVILRLYGDSSIGLSSFRGILTDVVGEGSQWEDDPDDPGPTLVMWDRPPGPGRSRLYSRVISDMENGLPRAILTVDEVAGWVRVEAHDYTPEGVESGYSDTVI